MDSVVRAVIEAIHASPTHVVLCLSGGAAQVCFARPGFLCSSIFSFTLGYDSLKDYSLIAFLCVHSQ